MTYDHQADAMRYLLSTILGHKTLKPSPPFVTIGTSMGSLPYLPFSFLHRHPRGTMAYMLGGMFGLMFTLGCAVLRRPTPWWGWVVYGMGCLIAGTFVMICQMAIERDMLMRTRYFMATGKHIDADQDDFDPQVAPTPRMGAVYGRQNNSQAGSVAVKPYVKTGFGPYDPVGTMYRDNTGVYYLIGRNPDGTPQVASVGP